MCHDMFYSNVMWACIGVAVTCFFIILCHWESKLLWEEEL